VWALHGLEKLLKQISSDFKENGDRRALPLREGTLSGDGNVGILLLFNYLNIYKKYIICVLQIP
jgi:hypothetical protein